MNNSVREALDTSFIKRSSRVWDKRFLEGIINLLKEYQSFGKEASQERCFTELVLEVEQAYRVFLRKINDLPMMMKCRVKGDDKAHFGGQECGELVRAVRTSTEKYLRSTNFQDEIKGVQDVKNEGFNSEPVFYSIYELVLKLRDMARADEKVAKEIEAKVYQEYVSLGKDHTLDALKAAGYNFDNVSL